MNGKSLAQQRGDGNGEGFPGTFCIKDQKLLLCGKIKGRNLRKDKGKKRKKNRKRDWEKGKKKKGHRKGATFSTTA